MTAPARSTETVRWDTNAITTYLRRRYPRVPLWWSTLSQSWMAMVLRPTSDPHGDELVEAATPAGLEQRLQAAGVRPVVPPQAPPRPRRGPTPGAPHPDGGAAGKRGWPPRPRDVEERATHGATFRW